MSKIEEFLLEKGLLTGSEIEQAKRVQNDTGDQFFSALRRASLLQGSALATAISEFFAVPLVSAEEWPGTPILSDKLSHAFLRDNKILPLATSDDEVILAMADPSDTYVMDAVRMATGLAVSPRTAAAEDIDAAIERAATAGSGMAAWMPDDTIDNTADDVEHLRDMALGTPVVRLVNQLLQDAVNARATDIHIEPFQGRLSIRMRVDGMLRDIHAPPAHMGRAVVSRIKILSGLNIAERRLPQDGRARIKIDVTQLDLRVATMPTIHGEALVIRLLDNVRRALDLKKLGFSKPDEDALCRHLAAPYGMIVVTGPTGSGKTTTLATALTLLNESHRKILTIEDPIEYEIEGINQTQTKPAIGLTFASALRGFLRHDPDVIMVGEMRDKETAGIGIHAALTGHLVLTTLHTNTAVGAITRLLDMGVDAYLLASSLRCVVGQRLVRMLCTACRKPYNDHPDLPQAVMQAAGIDPDKKIKLWRAVGCDRCLQSGYADRIAIAEILDVGDVIRDLIKPDVAAGELEKHARAQGMTSMIIDGLRKCQEGLTTPEEVRRVALDI